MALAARAWAAKCRRACLRASILSQHDDDSELGASMARMVLRHEDRDVGLSMCTLNPSEEDSAAHCLQLDDEAHTHMAQVAHAAEVRNIESSRDGGAWKWAIRKRIWDLLEHENIAMHPRPVRHRILTFMGAPTAASPAYPSVLVMRTQVLQTVLRVSTRILTQPLPLYRVTYSASNRCNQCNTGRLNYNYESLSARFFSSRDSSSDSSDQSDTEAGDWQSRDESENSDVDELSEDDTADAIYSDHEIFEAFQSELTLDDDNEEKEAKVSQRGTHPSRLSLEEPHKDEQGKKPWNRKERVKACLDKLQRGPDGRYINVLEVATEVDMLIASYLKLRYQEDPTLAENSDEDEKFLEGIDIEKFKRLSKRLRDGTYEFQPIVQVPLPRKKIVKRKKKKLKKKHAF